MQIKRKIYMFYDMLFAFKFFFLEAFQTYLQNFSLVIAIYYLFYYISIYYHYIIFLYIIKILIVCVLLCKCLTLKKKIAYLHEIFIRAIHLKYS